MNYIAKGENIMPYLKIQYDQRVDREEELLKEASKLVASELGKPESYVMVAIEPEIKMSFGGSTEPAVFMELKSIGLPASETSKLSKALCDFVNEKLNVNKERVYINFADISGSMWGWKGSTF